MSFGCSFPERLLYMRNHEEHTLTSRRRSSAEFSSAHLTMHSAACMALQFEAHPGAEGEAGYIVLLAAGRVQLDALHRLHRPQVHLHSGLAQLVFPGTSSLPSSCQYSTVGIAKRVYGVVGLQLATQ